MFVRKLINLVDEGARLLRDASNPRFFPELFPRSVPDSNADPESESESESILRAELEYLLISSPSRASKPLVKKPVVVFDLDFTLLLSEREPKLENWLSLTEFVSYQRSDRQYHILYPKKMSDLIAKLFEKEIEIIFLTASTYDKGIILPLLEEAYGLFPNSFSCSNYYNALDFQGMSKGEKMASLVHTEGRIHPESYMLLVDDIPYNLQAAVEHGFDGVLATLDNPNYITQVERKIEDYLTTGKRPQFKNFVEFQKQAILWMQERTAIEGKQSEQAAVVDLNRNKPQ